MPDIKIKSKGTVNMIIWCLCKNNHNSMEKKKTKIVPKENKLFRKQKKRWFKIWYHNRDSKIFHRYRKT